LSDNNNQKNATRTLRTYDLESGEKLMIVYLPEADVVIISGYPVTRAQGDEGMDGQAVFLRRTDKKLFTVDTLSLSKLYI
jgi:hypothetical protein